MREIARRTSVGKIGACSARLAVVRAGQCQVTDTGHGPDVVHRPHDRFSVAEYAFQLVEGEQTLVDPMQMNDVGSAIGRCFRHLPSGHGRIQSEKLLSTAVQMEENAQPFSQKSPFHAPPIRESVHLWGSRLSIAHQHFSLDPDMGQRCVQARGGNSRSAGSFAGVDDQNAHREEDRLQTKVGRKVDITKLRCGA